MKRKPPRRRIGWMPPALLVSLALAPQGLRGDFFQEDRTRDPSLEIFDGMRVESIAIGPGAAPYLATSGGLYTEAGRSWRKIAEGSFARVVLGLDSQVYAARGDEILRAEKNGALTGILKHRAGAIHDFTVSASGDFVVVGPFFEQRTVTWQREGRFQPRTNVYAYSAKGEPRKLQCPEEALFAWSAASDARGRTWLGAKQGLYRWSGPSDASRWMRAAPPAEELWLLGEEMRGIEVLSSGEVWFGTDLGVTRYDPPTQRWIGWRPDTHSIPMVYVRAIAREPDGSMWFGSDIGAARWSNGTWAYYQGQAWLPDDRVLSIAVSPDRRVLLGTARGLGAIGRRKMTLSKKAEHFSSLAQKHHVNRFGFIWRLRCRTPGDIATAGESGYTDNDGLWSAAYIGAEALRYAVTGDPRARRNARRSMEGLMLLETVTGIRGYPARSCALAEQTAESPQLASWHRSPDGRHVYKGDTSTDEAVGHYFAHALYYDHVASEEEKARQRELVSAMTDHIIEHGLHFVERQDGEPTRWGIWSPERCWKWGHYWYSSRLWSLCILSHLKVAHHVTRKERYRSEYRRLIEKHDYARRTRGQKITFGEINHSDDQMAILSYYPLLRYERDPALRATYLESLRESWEVERPEESALWNLVYNWALSNRVDLERTRDHLRRMPWMLYAWTHDNSRRWDLPLAPLMAGRVRAGRPLPMTEIGPYYFTSNPYELRAGDGGRTVESPAIFLLPYWIGRYHGLIEAGE